MGFGTFLLSRDLLGHKLLIKYRGNSTYNTYVGSVLSICIYVLVLVQLIQKTANLVDMRDPSVRSLRRPMFEEESTDFGDIMFKDFRFNLGVFFLGKDDKVLEIPANIGRIFVKERGFSEVGMIEKYEAKKCTKDMFSHVNINLTPLAESAFENSYCFDPDTARINGLDIFSDTLVTDIFF